IASEISYCTTTVFYGISQPVEKLLVDANFFRSLVAIMYNNLPNVTKRSQFFNNIGIASIPGCFVVGKEMYSMLTREFFHFTRVFKANCKGFFDHDMNFPRRTYSYHFEVFVNAIKGSYCFRVGFLQHRFKRWIPQRHREVMLL